MIENKRILAVIPARGGSKGVPGKNLRCIQGTSLLERTIQTSKASRYIDRVIVSSDDDAIIQEAQCAGADVPFIRPKELAADDTPGIDPILHAIHQLPDYDYVIVLQVTSPLRTTEDIDHCITQCFTNKSPACVSVTISNKHPFWMYTLEETLMPLFPGKTYSRRQDLPPVYSLNGALYLAKVDWLQHNKTFLMPETTAYVMPQERSLDIDCEYDLFLLDAYLKSQSTDLLS